MVLYQQVVSNRISGLLAKYNIKEVHIPVKKNIHMLRPVKGKLGLKFTGIYCSSVAGHMLDRIGKHGDQM
jgi:hypothetical protein